MHPLRRASIGACAEEELSDVMSYDFRPSLDVQFTKAPAIAIAGPSGCGKTESAMRLARGYCGPGERFAVIDTEEKRALYKQKRYQPWDWLDFQPPFSPEKCVEVLKSAVGYKAVIFDSGSAEYDGEGGISDIQEETLERMCKGDPKRMEALGGPAWKEAKLRHKRVFMNYLRRYPTLVIVCLRAEPKVKFAKVDGRTVIVDAGYQPICEKQFMYDMLVGCKMTPGEAGIPEHIKKLEKELEPIFLDGKQIDEATGERLAVWTQLRAAGGSSAKQDPPPASGSAGPSTSDPSADEALLIKAAEWAEQGSAEYEKWWTGLTAVQRKSIGAARHEKFKETAAKVPA